MKTLGTLHSNYADVVACLRKGDLGSLCYRFAIVFMPGARWITMWHNNAVAQGYSGPSPPTSVQAHTHQKQSCIDPDNLELVGFLCVHAFSSHHFSHVKLRVFHKSHRGLSFFLSLSFYRELSMLLEKRTCEY